MRLHNRGMGPANIPWNEILFPHLKVVVKKNMTTLIHNIHKNCNLEKAGHLYEFAVSYAITYFKAPKFLIWNYHCTESNSSQFVIKVILQKKKSSRLEVGKSYPLELKVLGIGTKTKEIKLCKLEEKFNFCGNFKKTQFDQILTPAQFLFLWLVVNKKVTSA